MSWALQMDTSWAVGLQGGEAGHVPSGGQGARALGGHHITPPEFVGGLGAPRSLPGGPSPLVPRFLRYDRVGCECAAHSLCWGHVLPLPIVECLAGATLGAGAPPVRRVPPATVATTPASTPRRRASELSAREGHTVGASPSTLPLVPAVPPAASTGPVWRRLGGGVGVCCRSRLHAGAITSRPPPLIEARVVVHGKG